MDFKKFNHITTFIFDVDGVFTNSEVIVHENGDHIRTMSTRDGQAVKYALEAGYHVAVITKGFSEGVKIRFEFLGVPHFYYKLMDKSDSFDDLTSKLSLAKEEILYMGDDIPDLVNFRKAGVTACPSDAVPEIMRASDFISTLKGGHGCVREVIEKVMRIQGKWKF